MLAFRNINMELKDITKDVATIKESATFKEAVAGMVEHETNVLLVVDDAGVLAGLVSVSDLLDAIVPEYLDGDSTAAHFATSAMFNDAIEDTKDVPVSKFMTTDITTAKEGESIMAVAVTAIANKRFRIPVVNEKGQPVGLISRQGLKRIIAEQLHIDNSR